MTDSKLEPRNFGLPPPPNDNERDIVNFSISKEKMHMYW